MSARAAAAGLLLSGLAAVELQLVALPASWGVFRPQWLPVVLACWALAEPRAPVLLAGWLAGLSLDVLFGTALGAHALALVAALYVVLKLRSLLVVFPLWQAAAALAPAWFVYAFALFWIDGATDRVADPWMRWLPVLSSTLLWPLLMKLIYSLRAGRVEA